METLQDLILAAYRDAHTKAGQLAQEKIGPLTQQPADGGNEFTQMFGGN